MKKAFKSNFKLAPSTKERWITALRSGKYHQGHGQLMCDETPINTYCCLGVYREIVLRRKLTYNEGRLGFLPPSVKMPRSIQIHLSILNDNQRRSFKWIANWIKKNL